MIIDVHSHLFTLRTILTREAMRVITQRLADKGFPDFIVDAIHGLLDDLLERPRYLDERALLGLLFRKMLDTDDFNALLDDRLAGLPITITLRGGDPADLPVDVLRRALDQVSTLTDDAETLGKSVFDVVETLRIALLPTITDVADHILDQMDRDDAIVALMMDIRGPDEPERDRENFVRQIEGTEEAALQRPGRVLPFFGVHPEREDHFDLLKQAVEQRGFLGVKLYPSLGYEVDHPALLNVYDYCIDMDVPVLLHCGHGGFYRKAEFIDYCDPRHWEDVITGSRESLRVCFAHFGGWQSLGTPEGLDPGTWGHTILTLIRNRPNVFTDLAYHTNQMERDEDERHYFTKLSEMLEDDLLKRRMLYGSDSWLLRLDLTNTVYQRYFREKMTAEEFRQIAEIAPKEFLGFPAPGQPMRANLRRYIERMDTMDQSFGAEPATWLAAQLERDHDAERVPAGWSVRRDASARTWQAFSRDQMSNAQRHKGFRVARFIKLDDLRYFRPHAADFEHQCEHLARMFVQFAGQGVPFRGGWTETSSVEHFREVFERGDATLGQVALTLDSIFRYERGLA